MKMVANVIEKDKNTMIQSISIKPYGGQTPDQIFDLLLPIQCEEFGVKISREGQPDINDIPAFYQVGAGNFWVALADDQVIGTIALKDIGDRQVALRKMFVHKDYRGRDKAVAARLLESALTWAREHEVEEVYLGTTDKFLAAHRFYEKNGFAQIDPSLLPKAFPVMKIDSRFYRYRLNEAGTSLRQVV